MSTENKTYLTGEQLSLLELMEHLQQKSIVYHGWGNGIARVIKNGFYVDDDLKMLKNARAKYIKGRGNSLISSDMANLGEGISVEISETKVLYSVGSRTFSLYKNAEEYSHKTGQRIIQHLV